MTLGGQRLNPRSPLTPPLLQVAVFLYQLVLLNSQCRCDFTTASPPPIGAVALFPLHWADVERLSPKGKMSLGRFLLLFRFLILSCLSGTGLLGDSDLSYVTCGSVIKLLNTLHNVRLHSHEVKYGSGSGQQSVTGVTEADDSNSYWRIRGKSDIVCQRGNPIRCGETIRLTHINTGRNLHSHYFTSPLSGNQEVSAFGEDGEGDNLDNWTVVCSGTYWERNNPVRFKHTITEVLLSITGEQYGRPINGQREVHGMQYSNQYNSWKVMEGIFMKPMEEAKAGNIHSEL